MNELKKLFWDLKRVDVSTIITNPAVWGVMNFRISAFLWRLKYLRILYYFYFPVWRFISLLTGIEIYGKTKIGRGLKIIHFGQIFINPKTNIGNSLLIYKDVTIGSKEYEGGEAPNLGNNIKIGVGSRILGNLKIGNNCIVGANSIVTKSFPPNSKIIGINKTC